jgi:hypothetical protein
MAPGFCGLGWSAPDAFRITSLLLTAVTYR